MHLQLLAQQYFNQQSKPICPTGAVHVSSGSIFVDSDCGATLKVGRGGGGGGAYSVTPYNFQNSGVGGGGGAHGRLSSLASAAS